MSVPAPEVVTGNDTVDPAVPAAAPSEAPPAQEPAKKETDWKAEARKHEARAKENAKAAEELAEIKKSQMSDAEKATEERRVLEERARNLETENVRFKAAALHGISEENFDLLGTGSEDEVMARAERIGELEDAALELSQLKQRLADQDAMPGIIPTLQPGALPVAPDTSYPTGWFPSLRPVQTN